MKIIRQSRREEPELYQNKFSVFYKNWISINKYQKHMHTYACKYFIHRRKKDNFWYYSSVQFSSLSHLQLWPHGPQHARPSCPSPTPGVYTNSCPLSWWCHPDISSSVVPFSSCPQSFPASGSFPVTQFSAGGQSIRVSASTSVLPMSPHAWSPLGWTDRISL